MATVIRGDDNFDTADNATQTELDNKVVGKLLNYSITHFNTDTRVTTAGFTAFDVSYTPVSSSSTILLEVHFASVAARTAEAREGRWYFRQGTSNLIQFDGITPWKAGSYDQTHVGSIVASHKITNTSTTARNYGVYVGMDYGTVELNDEGGQSTFMIWEFE